jgi:RNA polymerase sigma-70 factor (ECF subfamily)
MSATHDAGVPGLAALFDAYADDVWRVLRRCGLLPADADDGLQQVFLVATRRLGDIEAGRERAFLCAVATRVAARLRQRRSEELAELVDVPEAPGRDRPDDALERRRLCAQLDALLATLEPGLRELVVLTSVAGLPRREVARVLGLPEGTVASRLRRAYGQLARGLGTGRLAA